MSSYTYGMTPVYAVLPMSCCQLDKESIFAFWQRRLFEKMISVFKWRFPRGWNEDYFLWTLYTWGYIAGIYTNEYGLIPQQCGLLGQGLYLQPDYIFVGAQYVQIPSRRIGDRCVLFRLRADYLGMMDIINFYAMQLAEAYTALIVNLRNSKLPFVFTGSDKKEVETLKKLADKIDSGEYATFLKQGQGSWETFNRNIKESYIAPELIQDIRKIMNAFNTEIGIPNTNVEKKERMVSDEVNSNNVETMLKMDEILDRLKGQCRELNQIAGGDIISVDWRFRDELQKNTDTQRNV